MATVVSKQNPKPFLYLTLLPNRLSIKALLGLVKMQVTEQVVFSALQTMWWQG